MRVLFLDIDGVLKPVLCGRSEKKCTAESLYEEHRLEFESVGFDYPKVTTMGGDFQMRTIKNAMRNAGENIDLNVVAGIKSLFAHLPYGEKEWHPHEMNFERNLKILFWALGLETVCEDRQAGGRADIVVNYRKAIYVFELKRDESAVKAIEQIREKGYAKPYLADGRSVYLIGFNFDTKTRQFADAA